MRISDWSSDVCSSDLRAFIPLLSSFACAVPGIMATRSTEDEKDRLTTILIAPLMTCSARLPVYTLIIGTFIPNTPVIGFVRMQGLRSEEHTSELQSLMRISYAVFCLKKKKNTT